MTALVVSPDYVSHYLPLSAVGSALRDAGREVVVATGAGLRGRVLADGFGHVELRLGAGSNARTETESGDQATRDFLAVTYEGMVATLEHQARRRLHDLLWDPEHVTGRLGEIVDGLRPELVLSDQLAFGASLALRALGVPYTAFLPGHPCQLPPPGQVFGYPARRPEGFAEEHELAALRALCDRAARVFTRRFNDTLLERLTPAGRTLLVSQYGSDGKPGNDSPQQRIADLFIENFNDPALITEAFHDKEKARETVRGAFGSSRLPFLKGALGIARGQLRQKLGRPAGHPGT